MMRLIRLLGVLLVAAALPLQAAADSTLLPWQPVQGCFVFTQLKQLQGLPVPLRSSGTIELTDNEMLWHTTAPVDSKLLITAAGVSQWQQQQFVAVAGSEFVGQLMLAVPQQDIDFITQQFNVQQSEQHCSLLRPVEAPLNQFFNQIKLCGETQLSSLTLQETNGNTTQITLQPEAEAQ